MPKIFNDAGKTMLIGTGRGARLSFKGWPSTGYIVTGLSDEYKELYAAVKCFGETSHTYAFGQDTTRFSITMLVAGDICKGASPLATMISAYKAGRIYKAGGTKAAITYEGVSHRGHVVNMTVKGQNAEFNMYEVNVELADPPSSGGA